MKIFIKERKISGLIPFILNALRGKVRGLHIIIKQDECFLNHGYRW